MDDICRTSREGALQGGAPIVMNPNKKLFQYHGKQSSQQTSYAAWKATK
jgi:hypothetical protein